MSFFRHLRKKGQTGQSLVILAIGFLALLGFVGIVTDVSVLFIRYSTMRRAVDAAAIAAAGQMRRVPDTQLITDPSDPGYPGIADGQATSVANLNLAARQFIEVYGLNPKNVVVETCRAQDIALDADGNPLDANGNPLFVDDGTGKQVPNTGQIPGTPAADPDTLKRYQELCTSDELKLVRVTAQIDSPTIFLRLLGFPTVTLTESAISQTAVLDVVMIFDVSESMLNETTYSDWDTLTPPQGVRYMPPYISNQDVGDPGMAVPRGSPWDLVSTSTEAQLDALDAPVQPANWPTTDPNYVLADRTVAFEPVCDPTTDASHCDITDPSSVNWQVFNPDPTSGLSDENRQAPREFCTVRAYPGSVLGNSKPDDWLRQEYGAFFNNVFQTQVPPNADPLNPTYVYPQNYQAQFQGLYDSGSSSSGPNDPNTRFSGFVPMFNSFACCNDPDGNYTFDDLICQPFKDARDAAHQFLARLDFLRGDRVAFVTFDRRAYIVDPDGSGEQGAMIETQADLSDSSGTLLRKGADPTLDDVVGVRAETTTYADTNGDGLWELAGGLRRAENLLRTAEHR